MIISDKQELKRCVKQLVRRADVCEADLTFDFDNGELGIEALLDLWARPAATPGQAFSRACADQTPFHCDAIAMFAALDAMDMPIHDLDHAYELQNRYERSAYLKEILDTMRAKRILVRVGIDQAGMVSFDDERLNALICADAMLFVPGRYGVDYSGAARRISEAVSLCNAHNVMLERFDVHALRFCLMPVCQDHDLTLHVQVNSAAEVEELVSLIDSFDGVRVFAAAGTSAEKSLIDAAVRRNRLLVCLYNQEHLAYALSSLGTRFVLYCAHAVLPEQMLGRWINAKEAIWQAMVDAYLPLARAGYELTSAAIERDIRRMLCDNMLSFCSIEGK